MLRTQVWRGSIIIEHLKAKNTVGYGYNALTDTYGDMIDVRHR